MNRRLSKITARIHNLLLARLGQGIDAARMVNDPLYARDVLLVCDAMQGTELFVLAGAFRRCAAADDELASRHGESAGFMPSRFIASIFGLLNESVNTGSDASSLVPPGAAPSKPGRGLHGPRGPGRDR